MAIRHLNPKQKPVKKERAKDLLESIQKDLQDLAEQVKECLAASSENMPLDKQANNKHSDPNDLIDE